MSRRQCLCTLHSHPSTSKLPELPELMTPRSRHARARSPVILPPNRIPNRTPSKMVKAEPVAPISLSPRRLRSRTTRVTTTSALATSAGPSVQVKQETEVSLKVEDAPAESSALPERKKRKYTKKKKVEVKVEAEAKVNVEREREVKQETSTSSKGKGKEISPAPFTAPRAVEAGSSFTCVLPQPVLPDDLGCDEPDMAEPSKIAKTDKAVKGKGKDSVKRTKR